MFGNFVELAPVKSGILRLMALERMSGLNEPITQVGITFAAEVTLLTVETARVVGWPPQAGVFGHGRLPIAIGFGPIGLEVAVELGATEKAVGVLDFAEAASDQDGSQARLIQGQLSLRQMG